MLLDLHESLIYFSASIEDGLSDMPQGWGVDTHYDDVYDVIDNGGIVTIFFEGEPVVAVNKINLIEAMQYIDPIYMLEMDAGDMDNASELLTSIIFNIKA